ncbi:NAD-dependent protein deacetylase HST1-like [Quercus lobata]|uniref:NAD-dependent protein deacetylase HST1-like n=1 Tax=Quercus lobata TaxID=97700 RepID=UPI0012472E88|nr:NAD-dependent protein deacetylase HST1-like [Quercus lobata]
MALKVKNDDNDESSEDEDTKFNSYITRQFKKFIKDANVKASDKDRKQSRFFQFKSQDKGKREFKDVDQRNNVPTAPNKALAATLSDTKLEVDSDDSDQDGIVTTFIATIESPEEAVELIDEEEELMESKFEKMDEQDDIHTTYSKLYKVFEKHEKFYRALRFENNFLAKNTKKLDAELFQARLGGFVESPSPPPEASEDDDESDDDDDDEVGDVSSFNDDEMFT